MGSNLNEQQLKIDCYMQKRLYTNYISKTTNRGTRVAQLVKHPTLDLSSSLDLRVVSSSPALGSALGIEPA